MKHYTSSDFWAAYRKSPVEIRELADKFVDAYVAGNANLLVTNDRHFDVLRQVDYPPVEVVSIDMFKSTINCSRFAVM